MSPQSQESLQTLNTQEPEYRSKEWLEWEWQALRKRRAEHEAEAERWRKEHEEEDRKRWEELEKEEEEKLAMLQKAMEERAVKEKAEKERKERELAEQCRCEKEKQKEKGKGKGKTKSAPIVDSDMEMGSPEPEVKKKHTRGLSKSSTAEGKVGLSNRPAKKKTKMEDFILVLAEVSCKRYRDMEIDCELRELKGGKRKKSKATSCDKCIHAWKRCKSTESDSDSDNEDVGESEKKQKKTASMPKAKDKAIRGDQSQAMPAMTIKQMDRLLYHAAETNICLCLIESLMMEQGKALCIIAQEMYYQGQYEREMRKQKLEAVEMEAAQAENRRLRKVRDPIDEALEVTDIQGLPGVEPPLLRGPLLNHARDKLYNMRAMEDKRGTLDEDAEWTDKEENPNSENTSEDTQPEEEEEKEYREEEDQDYEEKDEGDVEDGEGSK